MSDEVHLPSWMDHEPSDRLPCPSCKPTESYASLADELIERISRVEAIDREHLQGIRMIRDRLNRYLADLHDFDRSGVTS